MNTWEKIEKMIAVANQALADQYLIHARVTKEWADSHPEAREPYEQSDTERS